MDAVSVEVKILERGYSVMKMNKYWILAGTALTSAFVAQAAMAQSTATQEVEEVKEVVIKGAKRGAGPIDKEFGAKSKSTVGQDFISTQSAGQTIAEVLNVLPGVNFTSNDPYGSSGGGHLCSRSRQLARLVDFRWCATERCR